MTPIDFDESNFTYTAPLNMDNCDDLKVYKDDSQIISCWEMTPEEKISALFYGRVWLYIIGQAMPPVSLVAAQSTFRNEEEQNIDYDQVRREAIDNFIARKAQMFLDSYISSIPLPLMSTEKLLGDFLKFALGINSIAENNEKV